jgi:hypothetical protein
MRRCAITRAIRAPQTSSQASYPLRYVYGLFREMTFGGASQDVNWGENVLVRVFRVHVPHASCGFDAFLSSPTRQLPASYVSVKGRQVDIWMCGCYDPVSKKYCEGTLTDSAAALITSLGTQAVRASGLLQNRARDVATFTGYFRELPSRSFLLTWPVYESLEGPPSSKLQ